MDDRIYLLTKKLKLEMDNDPRFVRLAELEKELDNNNEIILLSMKKDEANNHYNDLLKIYKDDDEVVIKARKELIKRKDELDSHPLVKEYLKVYSEIRLLLLEMNDIIFKDLKGERH